MEWLASLGLNALFRRAVGSAASGVRGVGKWLGSLDLVHACLLLLALFAGWQTVGRWAQHRHAVKVEAQLAVATKALDSARSNEASLKAALAKQNAAVADLGAKSEAQQNTAAKALQMANQRAAEAQAVSGQLKASSRVVPLKSAPACEPSDALKGQWQ